MDSIAGFSSETMMMQTAMDSQTFGAQVVTKTLDYMNSGDSFGGNSASADYDFQTSVLSAAYGGSGGLFDVIA